MNTLKLVTLSEAMRILEMHPHNKKRSIVKKTLTQYTPKPLANQYAIYSRSEVEELKSELYHTENS